MPKLRTECSATALARLGLTTNGDERGRPYDHAERTAVGMPEPCLPVRDLGRGAERGKKREKPSMLLREPDEEIQPQD
jgi:hypothetical protein